MMLKHLFFYTFIFASTVLGLVSPIGRDTVAVYWGQNALLRIGGQRRLSTYCQSSAIDIILISFLRALQKEDLNLADSIGFCQPINGTDLVYCPQMEEDIIRCQKAFGKTIMLSIGGAAYDEGGFPDEESASDAADNLWASFGPITENTTAIRPFGKAVVDGFDFDFESPNPNLYPFGSRLRSHMDEYMESKNERLLLTAAPQCPFPNSDFGPLLNGSIYYDAVWVQFYNNFCGADRFLPENTTQYAYNFYSWDKWAYDTCHTTDVKIFMGIPGGETASPTGYISGELLNTVIQFSRKYNNYGGVMIWEMATLFENHGFLKNITDATNRSAPSILKSDIPPKIPSTPKFIQNSSTSLLISESDTSTISWATRIGWFYYMSIFLIIIQIFNF